MTYYGAPMEGITGFVFRNAHKEFFGGIEKYFCPFISPGISLSKRGFNDILPENNDNTPVVPQLLTNSAGDFISCAEKLADMGYETVNFNLGCPSGTVVAKKKGAGFLSIPDELDIFLDKVFRASSVKISLKTRIGVFEADEVVRLTEIYNRYPLTELIVHPRLRTQMYSGKPDLQAFEYVLAQSKAPVVYNGDLFTTGDISEFEKRFPTVGTVMLGRGLLINAALPLGKAPEKPVLRAYHDRISEGYLEIGYGHRNMMFRMKELWSYLGEIFADAEKPLKAVKKAKTYEDYMSAVDFLFASCDVKTK